MLVRVGVILACLGVGSAVAEELGPDQARAFVVGKLFSYTCFDGTEGMGRIFSDGSVVGTIKAGGQSQARFAALPAGTIKVSGTAMCAHLPGLFIEPCFRVQKLDYRSFRGSLAGLSFAYCDFHQHNPRTQLTAGAEPRSRFTGGEFRQRNAPAANESPRATPIAVSRPSLRPAIED
ncbi:MAG TPA: hypothetical protein VMJ52_02615 [Xanthobacteraceae bacterium]|nr:hypothetical protein [Xanthobacteraceae bacterium]